MPTDLTILVKVSLEPFLICIILNLRSSRAQGFFGNIGLPPEMAIPIGVLEVVGGFVILLGVLTRIASILFIIEMIGATFMVKISEGLVGGFELELLLMAISISLLLTGPGRISIEYDVLRQEIFPRGRELVPQVTSRS